jgi:glutamyl/glutaminyl-tRNA synthetase
MRKEQMKHKQPPKYDRRCRDLTQEERAQFIEQGTTSVVRFKTPLEGETTFADLVYGSVAFKHDTLDDFVLPSQIGRLSHLSPG